MTQTLTQLVASVQAYLLDNGTRFTTATCTAAIRAALNTWNLTAPINAATLIDAVADQKDYELSDSMDATYAIEITDILEYDEDGDDHIPLKFDQWTEDERIFFRLACAQPEQEAGILARFTIPHTINGLDSFTDSTLSALYDQVLIIGAAGEACAIRSRGRAETINLQDKVTPNYAQLARELKAEYLAKLATIASKKKMPTSEPDTHAWNDEYHNRGWDR
jgi:hypothetical protein